jgi:hypothetical protein
MKGLFKAVFFVLTGVVPTVYTDTFDDMNKLGIQAKVVKEIPANAEAAGYYDGKDIWLDVDMIKGGRVQADIVVAHELIHKIRHQHGLDTGSRLLEETIAVYCEKEAVKILFDQSHRQSTSKRLRDTLRVNGLEGKADEKKVKKEVEKTLTLLRNLVKMRVFKKEAKGNEPAVKILYK